MYALRHGLSDTAQAAPFLLGCFTIVSFCAAVFSIILWHRLNDLRRSLERGLGALDRGVLGVGVTAGRTSASLLRGQLCVADLTVENPEGYKSQHLLHAGNIELDIDLTKLAWHGGRHLCINHCKIFNLDAIIEKTRRSSNVHEVVNYLAAVRRQEAVKEKREEEQAGGSLLGSLTERSLGKVDGTMQQVYLHTAVAKDINIDVMARRSGAQESLHFVIDEVKHCEKADEVRECEWRSVCRSLLQTMLQEVSKQVAKREAASGGSSCAVGVLRAVLDAAAPPPRRPR